MGQQGSREKQYERVITEFLTRQDQPETVNVTINRLCVAFLEYAQSYYVKDGAVTAVPCSLRPLIELYGRQIVADFGPKQLILVCEQMIERGWFRKTVNDSIKRTVMIRRPFRCDSAG